MTLTATPTWLLGPEIAPAARIGTVLNGTYRLDALLGQGRTGITYNAWHLRQKMPFAVTLLHRDLQPTHDQVSKLRQDLRTLGGLGLHRQGLPAIELSFAPDGAPFLAMELLVGETLRERLKRGPLPALAAGFVVAGLARALERAHTEGVVHGDLRPERIFLMTGQAAGAAAGLPQPALLGTALHHLRKRQVGLDEDVPLERLAYLAPEQASGEIAQPDAAGDIFALGAVLYECLTGQGAFASTELEVMLEKLAQPPPALELPRQVGAPPGLAAGLDQVLRQACARDPEERLQSMQVLLGVLGQIYAGVGLALPEAGDDGPPSVQAKVARRSTVAVKRVVPVRKAPETPDAKDPPGARGPASAASPVVGAQQQDGPAVPAAGAGGQQGEPGPASGAQAVSPSAQTPRQRAGAVEGAAAAPAAGPAGAQPARQRPVKSTVKARDLSKLMADIAAGRLEAAQALAMAAGEIEEEAAAAVPQQPELSEAERIAAAGRAAVLARAEAARQARERDSVDRQALAAVEQQQQRQRELESARAAVFARMRAELQESDERRRMDREERRRLDKERAENARRALERLEQERAEAARRVAEEAERARREAEEAERARREVEKAEAARQEAERTEAERREVARVEQERAEAARREVERIASEQAAARLREMAQAEAARHEAERAEAAGIEAAERERERRAAAQAAEAAAWAALQMKQAAEAAAAEEAQAEVEAAAQAEAQAAAQAEQVGVPVPLVESEADGRAGSSDGRADLRGREFSFVEEQSAQSVESELRPRQATPGSSIKSEADARPGSLDGRADLRGREFSFVEEQSAQSVESELRPRQTTPGSSLKSEADARPDSPEARQTLPGSPPAGGRVTGGGRGTGAGGSRAAQERAAALLRAEAEVREAREREARLTTAASEAEAEAVQARERAQAAAQSAAAAADEGRQRAEQAERAAHVADEALASQAREVALAAQAELATHAARAVEEEHIREVAAAELAEREAREAQGREASRVRRLTEAMTVVKQTIQLTLADVEDEMEAMAEQAALQAQRGRAAGPAQDGPAPAAAAPAPMWTPQAGDPSRGSARPQEALAAGPARQSAPAPSYQPPAPGMTAEEAVRLASGIYVDRNALGPPSGLYQAQAMPVQQPLLQMGAVPPHHAQMQPQMRPQLQHQAHGAPAQQSHLMPMVTAQIRKAPRARQPPSWQIWALGVLVVVLATIVCVLALLVVLK